MKSCFLLLLCCTLLIAACKNNKDDEPAGDYFPVLSFLKSQITSVDTSMFRIIKIVRNNGGSDTVYLKREQFKEEAKDFLTLPDISSDDLRDEYIESKQFDPELQQVSLMYMPKNKDEDNELLQQNVIIKPDPVEDKVTAIFADRLISNKDDSYIQKKLFWEVNKRFKIVTIIQKKNEPERTETVEVIWN